MGRHGFVQPNSVDLDVINVGDLDQMASTEGLMDRIELGDMKVLGRGKVTRKLTVSAAGFSAVAKEKIEAAGGEAVEI